MRLPVRVTVQSPGERHAAVVKRASRFTVEATLVAAIRLGPGTGAIHRIDIVLGVAHCVAGFGPAVVLLHGFPETHVRRRRCTSTHAGSTFLLTKSGPDSQFARSCECVPSTRGIRSAGLDLMRFGSWRFLFEVTGVYMVWARAGNGPFAPTHPTRQKG